MLPDTSNARIQSRGKRLASPPHAPDSTTGRKSEGWPGRAVVGLAVGLRLGPTVGLELAPGVFVTVGPCGVGVGAVGIWDELFFICTVFTLLRRHFPVWQANLLQAVIFVSFLWELGYRAWGPLLTIPFALLQGWLFAKTRSLGYVLTVHLLFDAIVFLAIVHAHNREWLPIFLY